MFDFFEKWLPDILFIAKGIGINLEYTVISVTLGLIIGSILSICKVSNNRAARFFANSYTSIFRGTPLMIQLSIIYYVLPSILGIKISVFMAAIASFSLNSGAYVSEILRSGINSVDKGQFEAAKSLGLSEYTTFKYIIFPQAIRKILPAIINELINMLKETSIISIIGEAEILRRAQMIANQKYNYVVPLLTTAICYYLLVMILVKISEQVEKKLQPL